MIHILEPPTDIQNDWVQYEDFEERLPCTDFDVPENPYILLRLRVLSAHAWKIINNKPKNRFAIEYLTLGKWKYIPNVRDIQIAYDYARQIVEDNLSEWSQWEDVLAEVVRPTQASIESFLQAK
jgi:hypothetical protein